MLMSFVWFSLQRCREEYETFNPEAIYSSEYSSFLCKILFAYLILSFSTEIFYILLLFWCFNLSHTHSNRIAFLF